MLLRKATFSEIPTIWEILQQAIVQRKQDGSKQWQNGYPNERTIENDIMNGNAFVLIDYNFIIAYAAIIFGEEPAYKELEGKWLSNEGYAIVHRVATSNAFKRKGIATQLFQLIEEVCVAHNVYSVRADTNFDNIPMLNLFDKLGFIYCGEILITTSPRKAFEKIIERK